MSYNITSQTAHLIGPKVTIVHCGQLEISNHLATTLTLTTIIQQYIILVDRLWKSNTLNHSELNKVNFKHWICCNWTFSTWQRTLRFISVDSINKQQTSWLVQRTSTEYTCYYRLKHFSKDPGHNINVACNDQPFASEQHRQINPFQPTILRNLN